MNNSNRHSASFRDPSGFVYKKDGIVYRFVSTVYQNDFELLQSSGLYKELVQKQLIVPFEIIPQNHFDSSNWFTTLKPQQISFLSYANEWCFEQLKDAALTTLAVCRKALSKGMILKDATHYNIQFINGKAVHIDSLSFEKYADDESWVAYRQFCECFLNPLLLASYCNLEVHKLMQSYADGVPASVTSSLLPFSTRLNTAILLHVHLQAKIKKGKSSVLKQTKKISSKDVLNILQHLESYIQKLHLKESRSTWNNYYDETIISNNYLEAKKKLVTQWLGELNYQSVVDFGANEGEFSKLCSSDASVVATDFDSNCIESLYKGIKQNKITNILPLVLDITQPTPATGWNNAEQFSFLKRAKFDLGLALALVHHLAIGKNVPITMIAELLSNCCKTLVIEFVPKDDPKVLEMLSTRKDIFDSYTQDSFENSFLAYFTILKKETVEYSNRILYLMQKN
jgi:ribosomal protein L11 methylase PrmA